MFNIRKSSNSEEEYIAKVLAAFIKIRQQEEKQLSLQLTQLLQQYKQEEVNLLLNLKKESQNLEEQINQNLKQEQQQKNNSNEIISKPSNKVKHTGIKEDKYQQYGTFDNGVYICVKCQSRVKRTQDLLKHWTVQHGRQATSRRKRNIMNEDTQCIKKVASENLKQEPCI